MSRQSGDGEGAKEGKERDGGSRRWGGAGTSETQVYVSNQEIAITTCSPEQMGRNSITEGGLQARSVHRFKIITPLSVTKGSERSKRMQTLEDSRVDERRDGMVNAEAKWGKS